MFSIKSNLAWWFLLVPAVGLSACAVPQRDQVYRLPAGYNFEFYDTYNEAGRSF